MRKLITISFLAVYILGNTEVGQLVNFPKLITHYHGHQYINPEVSFVDFISMHYFGDDGITTDDSEDGQLPFRQLHKPFSSVSFVVPPFASFNSNTSFPATVKITLQKNQFPQPGFSILPLHPPELMV